MFRKRNRPADKPAPIIDEPLFLIEKEPPWSEMLADVLRQNDIPFYRKPRLGAALAMKVGTNLEWHQFFVPRSHFQAAKEIVDELFSNGRGE